AAAGGGGARARGPAGPSGGGGGGARGGDRRRAGARQYAGVDRVPRALRRIAAAGAAWLHGDHALGRKLRRVGLSVVDRHLDVMAYFPPRDLARGLSPELARELSGHDPFAAARATH